MLGKVGFIEPPKDRTEAHIVSWLNNLGANLGVAYGREVLRRWSHACCDIQPSGSNINRKPDLILIDERTDVAKPEWKQICALGETTVEKDPPSRIKTTIKQKSFVIFTTQPDRTFVPSISFTRNHFSFTVCDRSGVVSTGFIPLKNNKHMLLRILAGLMLGTDEDIGYDTTMHHTVAGDIDTITVKGVEYRVVENLFMSKTMRGRATQCWHVSKDDKSYIIKDSWIATTLMSNEIETLNVVEGVPCVPTLIAGIDVELNNGKPMSTETRRVGVDFDENRVRRRLVMTPVGQPLDSFTSKKELIGAMIDIVHCNIDFSHPSPKFLLISSRPPDLSRSKTCVAQGY